MIADNPHIQEVEEQAALFALGALLPEDASRFRQRLEAGCSFCQSELQEFERVVAALPLSVPEISPPSNLRERMLDRIGAARQAGSDAAAGQGIILRAGDSDWEQSPVPGVQMRDLLEQKTMLVRMAPKTWYPAHDHAADEQCLILEGSLSTAGVTAYTGDFTYMPAGSSHPPLYSEDGCLLLVAYT